jgi:hypothetical protein
MHSCVHHQSTLQTGSTQGWVMNLGRSYEPRRVVLRYLLVAWHVAEVTRDNSRKTPAFLLPLHNRDRHRDKIGTVPHDNGTQPLLYW